MALDTISVAKPQERRIERRELDGLLAQAGLELWQAPEGFWAVRLKQVPVPPRRHASRKAK